MNKKKIIFGGDFYVNKDYQIEENLRSVFTSADFCFLNLEAPIITKNNKIYNKAGVNLFQDEAAINILKSINVKYLSLANNHIMDYGLGGVENTKNILISSGINFSGFGHDFLESDGVIDLSDLNVSVICVAEEEYGVSSSQRDGIFSMYDGRIISVIKNLKSLGRLIVVYSHGGGEMIPLPSKYIQQRYKDFIDSGVSFIIGHHPHVIQGEEIYKNGFIFYSLGNFIHSQFKKSLGFILEISLDVDSNKILEFKKHFVEVENNKVFLAKNTEKCEQYIENVNKVLSGNTFNGVYQEQAFFMFESYYKKYFSLVFSSSIFFWLKSVIKKYILKRPSIPKDKYDSHLLFHLLRNKSHHSFIIECLGVKTGEFFDYRNENTREIFQTLNNYIKNE